MTRCLAILTIYILMPPRLFNEMDNIGVSPPSEEVQSSRLFDPQVHQKRASHHDITANLEEEKHPEYYSLGTEVGQVEKIDAIQQENLDIYEIEWQALDFESIRKKNQDRFVQNPSPVIVQPSQLSRVTSANATEGFPPPTNLSCCLERSSTKLSSSKESLLTTVPGLPHELSCLSILNCSGIKVSADVIRSFSALTSLRHLVLASCGLKDLEFLATFVASVPLERLNVAFNEIETLPRKGTFLTAPHCREINETRLEERDRPYISLPTSLFPQSLRVLDISYNQIRDAGYLAVLEECEGLQVLKARGNKFSEETVRHNESLQFTQKLPYAEFSDAEATVFMNSAWRLSRCSSLLLMPVDRTWSDRSQADSPTQKSRNCNGTEIALCAAEKKSSVQNVGGFPFNFKEVVSALNLATRHCKPGEGSSNAPTFAPLQCSSTTPHIPTSKAPPPCFFKERQISSIKADRQIWSAQPFQFPPLNKQRSRSTSAAAYRPTRRDRHVNVFSIPDPKIPYSEKSCRDHFFSLMSFLELSGEEIWQQLEKGAFIALQHSLRKLQTIGEAIRRQHVHYCEMTRILNRQVTAARSRCLEHLDRLDRARHAFLNGLEHVARNEDSFSVYSTLAKRLKDLSCLQSLVPVPRTEAVDEETLRILRAIQELRMGDIQATVGALPAPLARKLALLKTEVSSLEELLYASVTEDGERNRYSDPLQREDQQLEKNTTGSCNAKQVHERAFRLTVLQSLLRLRHLEHLLIERVSTDAIQFVKKSKKFFNLCKLVDELRSKITVVTAAQRYVLLLCPPDFLARFHQCRKNPFLWEGQQDLDPQFKLCTDAFGSAPAARKSGSNNADDSSSAQSVHDAKDCMPGTNCAVRIKSTSCENLKENFFKQASKKQKMKLVPIKQNEHGIRQASEGTFTEDFSRPVTLQDEPGCDIKPKITELAIGGDPSASICFKNRFTEEISGATSLEVNRQQMICQTSHIRGSSSLASLERSTVLSHPPRERNHFFHAVAIDNENHNLVSACREDCERKESAKASSLPSSVGGSQQRNRPRISDSGIHPSVKYTEISESFPQVESMRTKIRSVHDVDEPKLRDENRKKTAEHQGRQEGGNMTVLTINFPREINKAGCSSQRFEKQQQRSNCHNIFQEPVCSGCTRSVCDEDEFGAEPVSCFSTWHGCVAKDRDSENLINSKEPIRSLTFASEPIISSPRTQAGAPLEFNEDGAICHYDPRTFLKSTRSHILPFRACKDHSNYSTKLHMPRRAFQCKHILRSELDRPGRGSHVHKVEHGQNQKTSKRGRLADFLTQVQHSMTHHLNNERRSHLRRSSHTLVTSGWQDAQKMQPSVPPQRRLSGNILTIDRRCQSSKAPSAGSRKETMIASNSNITT